MKQANLRHANASFSALGRAVWDETSPPWSGSIEINTLSVLSVEPYGMKPRRGIGQEDVDGLLSVLSVEPYGMKPNFRRCPDREQPLSVLSVEPYGMKHSGLMT